ncbi:Uncharacterized protein conserved in bacteria [Burkholderia pseudomallei]|nr:Uncharacterized protein conserved in bacteria [Burkholderia pseudomallei]CAJ3874093.1 Uncharacterized protein conserved in bacteria [Burkholderia pseudomallei]CAJ5876997.1 Uncharacterized protein conserved in bacteria [Burkholderia pseudomallei]CAJ8457764.1 Uncharacterized protein conserved in bacteria [Burkholderia pseudomallei]CAJ8664741.1 Uncharacterized protein conserved in bacteria [Burkholderia pseudomallei]
MPREQLNILIAFVKRRLLDAQDIKAVIKVGAKAPLSYHLLYIAMRRGNDASANHNRVAAAKSLEFSLFKEAQKIDFTFKLHVANLVKKKCAAICLFKPTYFSMSRASERPTLVSEKL